VALPPTVFKQEDVAWPKTTRGSIADGNFDFACEMTKIWR
jgi:hypothetical protein